MRTIFFMRTATDFSLDAMPGPSAQAIAANRCVAISRHLRNGWTREYCGVLMRDLELDTCMVVILDRSNRLVSSKIQSMVPLPDGGMLVETQQSTYVVRTADSSDEIIAEIFGDDPHARAS